ncbi:PI-PLC X domain-containing protein 3 isoform X2 [Poecilia reticulata]|uniref:PI-PLC X domain-containing protein 3 isoform X2 n=1 Tax=Poecilia reticulata TaxID=8081 RepID=UPI0004A362DA|nr:PREDICTED: PI-PLC X domain-containing protein 3-like isoform X2 [Poecilia reticulata]
MRTRPAGIGNVHADWMGSLPSILSAMPLKHLAVPGSHDSFTFWVDVHAPVGPDQKSYVKYLATMFSVLAKKVMVKWSMTQNLTFREQLDAGIRYFDLRVSSKPGEPGNEIYFIHGLFGHKVRDGLLEINSFLNRHKKEEVFGSKLCSDCAVENITLNYLWEKKYQVIVFYHHPSAQGIPVMWPGNKIPAPWANTTEPNKLIQFLETTLKERNKQGSFHVTQAILTPTANTVAKGLVWGLREYLVERNLPTIMSWVQSQRPGVDGVNIVTSDFVELTDFANIVIKLNNLLLSESERKPR